MPIFGNYDSEDTCECDDDSIFRFGKVQTLNRNKKSVSGYKNTNNLNWKTLDMWKKQWYDKFDFKTCSGTKEQKIDLGWSRTQPKTWQTSNCENTSISICCNLVIILVRLSIKTILLLFMIGGEGRVIMWLLFREIQVTRQSHTEGGSVHISAQVTLEWLRLQKKILISLWVVLHLQIRPPSKERVLSILELVWSKF